MPAPSSALVRRFAGAALPATVLVAALLVGVLAPSASAAVGPGPRLPTVSAATLDASAGIGLKFQQPLATRPVAPVVAVAVRTAPTLAQRQAAARARAAAARARVAAARAVVVARVLRVAASLAGRPYRYGGTGPGSFDCSGYTRYVFALGTHRSLPHSSAAQRSVTRAIPRSAIRPGDLVFFVSGGHVYHVGIYAGHGSIWHAPHTGDHVRLEHIYTSSWVAGRVL
jgi:cell wall-associated NlpC family hydrolase